MTAWPITSTHYPSWGSETSNYFPTTPTGLGLTTPHGDLKPDLHEDLPYNVTGAHYPSWGSETSEAPLDDLDA